MFKNHSIAARKRGRSSKGLVSSSPSSLATKNEIRGMLEDFKSESLHTFALQIDKMQGKSM